MSYNKQQVLENNIRAIRIALSGQKNLTADETAILREYKGFGGIKAILIPLDRPDLFSRSDQSLVELIRELHQVLRDYSKDQSEYEMYVKSLKNSVLTSFYTPSEIISSIDHAFKDVSFQNMLEPSSGAGVFLDKITSTNKVGFEKDLITGKILSALHPDKAIFIEGFEKIQRRYEGTFDLVASNIPFGTIPVFDPLFVNSKDKSRREAAKSIHDYFFLKGMDMLQDGGVLAFITSTGVMDSPGNEFLRKALLKESNLISAVRLPHNLFIDTGGIEVGSDLILLQKNIHRDNKFSPEEKLFISPDRSTNNYFQDLSHVIHSEGKFTTNQFGKDTTVYYQDGGVPIIAEKLHEILKQDISKHFNSELLLSATVNNREEEILPLFGQLSLFSNSDFFDQKQKEVNQPPKENPLEKLQYEKYLSIKEVYFELKNSEQTNQIANDAARKLLNERYDDFILSHGYLQKLDNRLISIDSDRLEIISLEMKSGNGFEKADIFFEPVSIKKRIGKVTIHEALNISLNESNFIDLPYIGLLSGYNEDDVKRELLGNKIIYYNASSDEYQLAGIFLSGNVIEKKNSLYQYLDHLEPSSDRYKEISSAIDALDSVKPTPLSLREIGVNMGERWIPTGFYEDFAKHIFNPPGTADHAKAYTNIKYLPGTDDYVVANEKFSRFAHEKFSVKSENRSYLYSDVFRFALLDTAPDMTIKKMVNGVEVRFPDTKGIQEMNASIENIRQLFIQWLPSLPDHQKQQLEEIYNNRFRNSVQTKYDGGYQEFPGLDLKGLGIPGLYKSQKDAILMLKLNGGGIIDHEVGGGKTLIQCVASYEMKRLGLINKPCILGLKANVHDIAKTYQKAYPDAKLLYPTKKELDSDSIDTFLSKIQNNNWDAIILSHEQFLNIPQSEEIKDKIIQAEIEKLEETIDYIATENGAAVRQSLKQLEKRKESLEVKLRKADLSIEQHRGNVIDFKTMGIDHLFIDESHQYKNLSFVTKHTRAAGLGVPAGSQRAQNMLYAIRTIQERTGGDLGATFLSGTTVSNSLTELYNIFNYLRPKALQEQGIFSFDAWLATYAVKSKEFEFSVTNDIIQKERFRHFCKVPELADFYSQITDYKTANDIGVDRPVKNEILVNIPQTPDQVDMYNRLKDFAKNANGRLIFRDPLSKSEEKAKMLIATNTAMKASIDMRLIDPVRFGDHEHNKVNECVNRLLAYYKKYDHVKGTQFVFCDIGTYDKKKPWNIYSEIKDKLVAAGIPESEVQFIQEYKTDKRKAKFQELMNDGKIRIGLGSTQMLGTGVNAQERAVAVHHLDIPWTPKDFTQRNGRAVRAGNWVAKEHAGNQVDVYIYAVERTLDVYKFNLQATKHNFISQIKSRNINVRTIDEGSMDETTGMDLNSYIAILSGDRSLLEKAQAERKLAQLKSEEKTFYDKQHNKERTINDLNKTIADNDKVIDKVQEDLRLFNSIPRDQEGNIVFKLDLAVPEINKDTGKVIVRENALFKSYDNAKEAGIALNSLADMENKDNVNLLKVGKFYDFDVNVRAEAMSVSDMFTYKNKFFIVNPNTNILYSHNHGAIARTAEVAGEYPIKALDKIEPLLRTHQIIGKDLRSELSQIMAVDNAEFPKKDEITALEIKIKNLIRKIENNISSSPEMEL